MENLDIAIKVEHLSKIYKLYDASIDRLKEALHWRGKKYHKDYFALNDVSFEIKKGEMIGIIGKNGSGKSTLLKIITGVLTPSSGSVTVNGKVAALLELGAGFNPEYTGLENIYLQCHLIGYSTKEVDVKLKDILDFADIGEFVYQPVKNYSSGMFARLAFAVSISVNPDILIVDEALSVGDAAFQRKCYARIEEIKQNGTTILLVSHVLDDVAKNCSKALLLNNGCLMEFSHSRHVVNVFRDLLFGKKELVATSSDDQTDIKMELLSSVEDLFHTRALYQKSEYRWGIGGAKILDFVVMSNNKYYPQTIKARDQVKFCIRVLFEKAVDKVIYGFLIKTVDGVNIYGTNSVRLGHNYHTVVMNELVDFEFILPLCLNSGQYFVSFGITEKNSDLEEIPLDRRYDSVLLNVVHDNPIWGLVDMGAVAEMREITS